MMLVQLSIYRGPTYLGSFARAADGSLGPGVDPWVDEDLVSYSADGGATDATKQYRLLDAVYSAAIRNGVPTGVTGEAIMLLSRSFDLNAFVDPMDQLVLAYAEEGEPGDLSRILYAAITGPDRHIECFVYQPGSGGYTCFDPEAAGGAAVVGNGMVTPVRGVLTSGFGPRMHPIFKEVRVHKGVDWAAPLGTPVTAAFGGKVLSAGNAGGYGNMVRLSHPNGTETRYAHLSRFADGLVSGQEVAAGDLIGYVGTTGNSTGPHLHFEVYRGGEPIDPMGETVIAAAGGSAVAALVDRIIAVESAGNASARNPLSTATGAGQFISATWLRMIRTHRPDLARSLTEAEILELRNDPTISRDMVTELAREGEAYLKARGLEASPGRLYLAHFLGMEGAYRVLTAGSDMPLVDLLGPQVIEANPFLVGQTVRYVVNWADAKMAGVRPGSASRPPRAVQSDPAFTAYRNSVRSLIASASPTSD
ncbi:hypothetical protein DMC47_08875 [Nostoc sp. 3335mG]|nr:hypothetical protein DMC47_08875 [Nostoc sp. 3335mG]